MNVTNFSNDKVFSHGDVEAIKNRTIHELETVLESVVVERDLFDLRIAQTLAFIATVQSGGVDFVPIEQVRALLKGGNLNE